MPCKRSDCQSRDCICTKCNEEEKLEYWYCSETCRIQQPPKKRPRSEQDEIALNATRFLQVKDIYLSIQKTENDIVDLEKSIDFLKNKLAKLDPMDLKKYVSEKKQLIKNEEDKILKHKSHMQEILRDAINNLDETKTEVFDKLVAMANEREFMNDTYGFNLKEFQDHQLVLQEIEKEITDLNQEIENKLLLLNTNNTLLEKQKEEFEGYFK